ncbi:hypothetical protein BGW36DRAFT_57267 [Talaromyces proteolyticus]|uniref:Protein YAE1 n=1 Tax=Talaromyces proteolyticus TaxID=1131652 RepID=A0AAD4KFL5_9EURO|nr:uncharacterized protein BGW36DRAFT_57267 [Talaromyces proteolyticus]KAH8690551.1 hypothetical protein BGW36DRAFT_57267 [Talaromyces proteolyticus]
MPHSPSSSTHSEHNPADPTRSAPLSPTTTMTSTDDADDTAVPVQNNENSLDDIFGSSPPADNHITAQITTSNTNTQDYAQNTAELSDLPALRRQHVTAGYRDGIAASKSEHVQEGFDGGYPVGAQFGLRAGTVLGLLEGVIKGLQGKDSTGPVVKKGSTLGAKKGADIIELGKEKEVRRERIERIKKLYNTAVKELDVEALFGGLTAEGEGEGGMTEEQKPENRLRNKAEPVVAKWEKLVGVTSWEENMEALEMEEHTS